MQLKVFVQMGRQSIYALSKKIRKFQIAFESFDFVNSIC